MTYSLKDLVTSGKTLTPPRIVLYGGHGIGKSTWASEFPNPIFIQTEAGIDNIGPNRLPICKSYEDIMSYILMLQHDQHDYRTVVLDTGSSAEKIIEEKVCAENKNAISVASVPFGKGYGELTAYFNRILTALEDLRQARKMIVVIICHEKIDPVNSPDVEVYDRYNIDLDKRIIPDLCRWTDAIFFVREKVYTKKVDDSFGKKVFEGVLSGERILCTKETAAYVAKNRYNLPEQFSFIQGQCAKSILITIQNNFKNGNVQPAQEPAKQPEPPTKKNTNGGQKQPTTVASQPSTGTGGDIGKETTKKTSKRSVKGSAGNDTGAQPSPPITDPDHIPGVDSGVDIENVGGSVER